MTRTFYKSFASHSLWRSLCGRCAQALGWLALVWALAPPVFSKPTDSLRHRPGLRNSSGSQSLNARRLQAALDSLRQKTGFVEMRFDEAGYLTLGNRTRIAGGSATARELLIAALDGGKVFELENYEHSPQIAFARLDIGRIRRDGSTGALIEIQPLQLDFADFAQLRGGPEVIAAFDIGIAVLHELVHGVLHLQDAVGDQTRLGECDEYINRVRRELGLPERRHYSPRLRTMGLVGSTNVHAELLFVRAGGESGRSKAEKFYIQWEAGKVSVVPTLSHRNKSAAIVAAR